MLAAALVAVPDAALAQLRASNLLEAQFGNYPKSYAGRGPANREDFYDQVNLEYGLQGGLVGLRFETDRNSEQEYPYGGLTQRFAEWNDPRYRVRVGNFYTILGQGLIHRSFDLPGVVLDQRFPRSRYAPSRDVDGVLLEARTGPVEALAFGGSPSGGISSLAAEDLGMPRHSGQVSGGQVVGNVPGGARLGAAYLRSTAGAGQQEVGSGFVELDPLGLAGIDAVALPFYLEYAQSDRSVGEWFQFRTRDDVPHALYASTNLLWGALGISAEWKDYSQFRLGTNDPPSLVREHPQVLLNRNTHVLNAGREEGYQIEASYSLANGSSVTGNLSRGDGDHGFRFEERFVEVHAAPRNAERWEATAFYDRGRDDVESVMDRRTYGVASTVRWLERFSTTLDLQRQTAERRFSGRYQDFYLALTVAAAGLGSAALQWTRTSDPLDPSRADPGNDFLHLVGGVIGARLSQRHEATLFFGRRRGGLACTAGTCYEVQPFEGAELRLISRF